MKTFTLIAIVGLLLGCKNDEPQNTHPRVHTIELSDPLERVQVSVAGRDDLKVHIFERDGRLIAAIIDQRSISGNRLQEIQRWEMLAKSNQEVALTTRKDFYWLKHVDTPDKKPEESEAFSGGTVIYSDTNGDGIPDYLFRGDGLFFKVSTIGYEESETLATSFDIHELPSVTPEEFHLAPSRNRAHLDGTGQPATRPESKSEGGDKPQPEVEGHSR